MPGTYNDKPVFGGYTHDQLSDAFDSVADKGNWKLAIDAIVGSDADRRMIADAVIYFAGSIADFEELEDGTFRVTADGYYASVGA